MPAAFEVVEGGDAWAALVRAGKQPPRFTPGWHVDAIADHLQAVADGHIKRLLINVPPGTMKSLLTCVLWPAWLWARDPTLRLLFSSYSEEFTKRDARRSKALIRSEWFGSLFPDVKIKPEPDTMLEHHTTVGGERHGASTNSGVTGKHVHGIIEDDPLKTQDAQSARAREEAWLYRTQALGFRLLPEGGWRVVVMQRLHEDDPSGRILARGGRDGEDDPDAYVHLCLPMEFEMGRRCVTPIFSDPRKAEGELLWPRRMNADFVREKKSPQGLGEYGYAGQAQQRPAPAAGAMIKREWLRYYTVLPDLAAARWEQSWDLIFDGDGEGSFVVGQVWAQLGANHYLVYQYRERVDFVTTLAAFVRVSTMYPKARRKRVEKKANGAALISVLGAKVAGIVPVIPKGSKASRLDAVSPLFEAGNVWAPDPKTAPWVSSWVEEVVGMTPLGPSTANDDQVDTTTQYLSDKGLLQRKAGGFTIDLSVGARPSPWQL